MNRVVITVVLVTAAWVCAVLLFLVLRAPKPPQPTQFSIVTKAMAKADRLDLAQRRIEDVPPPMPVPAIPPKEVEEEPDVKLPPEPKKDICAAHGMRKQWYNKNRSWRCVHA